MKSHAGGPDYDLDQLQELGKLGTGSFGEVLLVGYEGIGSSHTDQTGSLFALKTVSVQRVYEANIEESVKVERAVLEATDSPFVVRLAASYASPSYFYLLLEVALGGDLNCLYQHGGFFGSEPHARFYSACALLALEHLHGRRILYRDVKMENLVLDRKGYVKVCDFGVSSFNFDRSFSICGTPEYMAPEVADGSGHTCAADWWSLGVLVYELLQGCSPFLADDAATMFAKARRGIDPQPQPLGRAGQAAR
jgi:serine/threonine protein kinase